jgi:cytochrome P450
MMEWRPNALRSSGPAHDRYRAANVDAIAPIDQHALRGLVETIADGVIKDFAGSGRADLLTQFAWVVAFRVLSALLECPDDVGARIADGMAKIFEASNAEQGNQILGHAVAELVALRRQYPGDGTTSRLLRHAANLNDEEMAHQLVTLYGAGIEPLTNLISNTTRLLLVDDELAGSIHTGHATVRDALDAVLYRDPPLAAYCITYPPVPTDLGGYVLPAHQPVVVSMAACNNDPVMAGHGVVGNRAHLSWGTGPHACPARPHAYLIAETAITYLLDALPELDLAVPVAELRWRPGPFHRALEELPVRFPAVTR